MGSDLLLSAPLLKLLLEIWCQSYWKNDSQGSYEEVDGNGPKHRRLQGLILSMFYQQSIFMQRTPTYYYRRNCKAASGDTDLVQSRDSSIRRLARGWAATRRPSVDQKVQNVNIESINSFLMARKVKPCRFLIIAKPLLNISTPERTAAQVWCIRKAWLASLDPWLSNSIHNLLDYSMIGVILIKSCWKYKYVGNAQKSVWCCWYRSN